MNNNQKSENKNRVHFQSIQAAKDFCNIHNRSGEDILYLPDQNLHFVEIETVQQAADIISLLNLHIEKQTKTIADQRGLCHEMTATIARLKEQLALWQEVVAITPIPPDAISYEAGWRILDAVQLATGKARSV